MKRVMNSTKLFLNHKQSENTNEKLWNIFTVSTIDKRLTSLRHKTFLEIKNNEINNPIEKNSKEHELAILRKANTNDL